MAYPKLMTAKAIYDFAVDGGAVSAITAADSEIVPANAVVTKAYSVVTTVLASGGSATLKLDVGGVAIVGAVAFDNAAYADEKVTEYDVADKTTSAGAPTFTIATEALTGGVVELYIQYYVSGVSA